MRDGRVVLDEQVDLPEGATVQVLVPEADEIDLDALDAELDASERELERGEYEDARAVAARLAAKA